MREEVGRGRWVVRPSNDSDTEAVLTQRIHERGEGNPKREANLNTLYIKSPAPENQIDFHRPIRLRLATQNLLSTEFGNQLLKEMTLLPFDRSNVILCRES